MAAPRFPRTPVPKPGQPFGEAALLYLVPVRLHIHRPLVSVTILLPLLPEVPRDVPVHDRLHDGNALREKEHKRARRVQRRCRAAPRGPSPVSGRTFTLPPESGPNSAILLNILPGGAARRRRHPRPPRPTPPPLPPPPRDRHPPRLPGRGRAAAAAGRGGTGAGRNGSRGGTAHVHGRPRRAPRIHASRAQSLIQPGLGTLPVMGHPQLPWQPVPLHQHPHKDEFLPNINLKSVVFQF